MVESSSVLVVRPIEPDVAQVEVEDAIEIGVPAARPVVASSWSCEAADISEIAETGSCCNRPIGSAVEGGNEQSCF